MLKSCFSAGGSPKQIDAAAQNIEVGGSMSQNLDKQAFLELANTSFGRAVVLEEQRKLKPEDRTEHLLARFIASCVSDLYGSASTDRRNGDRIALCLEHGSESLLQVARVLRRKTDS